MEEKKQKAASFPLSFILKKFVSYYKPHRKIFVLDMFWAIAVALLDLLYPMITRKVMSLVELPDTLSVVLLLCGLLMLIYLTKAVLNYLIQYYGHVMGVKIQADMRSEIFAKLQKLPFSYFDGTKTGQIMSRIINDLMDISELAHHGPEDLLISFLTIIGAFSFLATINWQISLILFLCIPVVVIFSAKRRLSMQRAFAESRQQVGEVNAELENAIGGIRVSRAFGSEKSETARLEVANRKFAKARGLAYRAMAGFFSGNSLILDGMNVVLLVSGGIFLSMGQLEVADFLIYSMYVSLLLTPIRKLVNFAEMYTNAVTGFERFLELQQLDEEEQPANPVPLANVKGEIRFEKVSFAYEEDRPVIRDLDLEIRPGERFALVGPSGGGKTTLCHLIPRFYEISGGKITIDGVDIRDVERSELRRAIGIVQQEVFLFGGTIGENIAYGKPGATREEIIEAAKSARLDEFVQSLPDGYDTQIGERGVKLSGGQKQRISIARVFLKNPPILILDEATSALDNFTEQAIWQALDQLCKGRTTLVVAHRLSTVRNANTIVVLDENGIRERGNHRSLMGQNGVYAALYRTQFLGLEEDETLSPEEAKMLGENV